MVDSDPETKRVAIRRGLRKAETLDAHVALLMTLSANLQRSSSRQFKSLWREQKLSERGLFIILLVSHGLDRPRGLIEYFDVLPSTITFETEKLAAAGFLTRESDPSDRRAVRLRLTKAGEAVHRETVSKVNGLLKPRLEALAPGEFEAFVATFRKLVDPPPV